MRGLPVMFTGKVVVDGEQMFRPRLEERLTMMGGIFRSDWSRTVRVLVHGDLTSQVVTDRVRLFSKKLIGVESFLKSGGHVHVINGPGFAALLRGQAAPCLTDRLRGR